MFVTRVDIKMRERTEITLWLAYKDGSISKDSPASASHRSVVDLINHPILEMNLYRVFCSVANDSKTTTDNLIVFR